MLAFARQLLLPLLIVLLLALLAVSASRFASLDWLVEHDAWLRYQIRAQPITAFVSGFVIYLLVSLIPGTAGKSLVLGWLYGVAAGVVIVNFALVAAAMVTFLFSRHYLQAAVQARSGLRMRRFQERMIHDGALYLLTLRLAHAPFSLMNYAAGAATGVSLITFWWTTQLGLLPGNIVFVYAGSRLPTLRELVRTGPLELLDGPLIAALAGTVALPWLTRRIIRRLPTARRSA